MTNKIKNILFGVAGVIVGLLFATMFLGGENTGGVYSNVTKDFAEGISVDGTVVIDGSGNVDAPITSSIGTFSSTLGVTGASTFGSDVTITTTNTATSSVSVGCIETYATSTATVMRLSATTTPGFAVWVYGACSGL